MQGNNGINPQQVDINSCQVASGASRPSLALHYFVIKSLNKVRLLFAKQEDSYLDSDSEEEIEDSEGLFDDADVMDEYQLPGQGMTQALSSYETHLPSAQYLRSPDSRAQFLDYQSNSRASSTMTQTMLGLSTGLLIVPMIVLGLIALYLLYRAFKKPSATQLAANTLGLWRRAEAPIPASASQTVLALEVVKEESKSLSFNG